MPKGGAGGFACHAALKDFCHGLLTDRTYVHSTAEPCRIRSVRSDERNSGKWLWHFESTTSETAPFGAKLAILERGTNGVAYRGGWTRLHTGDRRYGLLRIEGRTAGPAHSRGERAHPRVDVCPIYRSHAPRPGHRAFSGHRGSAEGTA